MLYLPPDPKPGEPIRADTLTAILKYIRQITPRSSGTCNVQTGAGGSTFRPIFPGRLARLLSGALAWPFEVYDASSGGTLQVRINSGDGQAGQINSQPALVNGNPITTPVAPATAPLLAAGTGYVYIKVWLNSDGSLNTGGGGGTGVDIIFSASALANLDTATPPTFALQLIAQLTQVESGTSASLAVSNSTNTGFSTFQLCGGSALFW
ncbi:MAG: hypothetical protein LV481_12730 [Methylacidiphilales bacterium]|nr:hypothetical protein [Candidatus Methylacidiphilales bacterium]